jgi:hypothetical protein
VKTVVVLRSEGASGPPASSREEGGRKARRFLASFFQQDRSSLGGWHLFVFSRKQANEGVREALVRCSPVCLFVCLFVTRQTDRQTGEQGAMPRERLRAFVETLL